MLQILRVSPLLIASFASHVSAQLLWDNLVDTPRLVSSCGAVSLDAQNPSECEIADDFTLPGDQPSYTIGRVELRVFYISSPAPSAIEAVNVRIYEALPDETPSQVPIYDERVTDFEVLELGGTLDEYEITVAIPPVVVSGGVRYFVSLQPEYAAGESAPFLRGQLRDGFAPSIGTPAYFDFPTFSVPRWTSSDDAVNGDNEGIDIGFRLFAPDPTPPIPPLVRYAMLAKDGDPVPVIAPDATIVNILGSPVIDDAGRVVFRAVTRRSNPVEVIEEHVFAISASNTMSLVASVGDAVAGGPAGTVIAAFSPGVAPLSTGDVVVGAFVSGPGISGANDRALLRLSPGGGGEILAQSGTPTPGIPGMFAEVRDAVTESPTDAVVALHIMAPSVSQRLIYRHDAAGATPLFAAGLDVDLGSVFAPIEAVGGLAAGGAGDVVATAAFDDPNAGIRSGVFYHDGTVGQLVAATDDAAPGLAGGTFNEFSSLAASRSGPVAIGARADVAGNNVWGVWTSSGAGSLDLTFDGSTTPAELGGHPVAILDSEGITSSGAVLILACLVEDGIDVTSVNDEFLAVADASGVTVIGRENDVIPGAATQTVYDAFQSNRSVINDAGQVVARVILAGSGVGPASDSAVVGYDPRLGPLTVLRENGEIQLQGEAEPTAIDGFEVSLLESSIRPSVMNNAGELVFAVDLDSGGTAVVRTAFRDVADVTATGVSRGDPDGIVDLSDFSDYLSRWVQGDPTADITVSGACSTPVTDGVVDLSDFSCYLSFWAAAF